MKFLKSLIVAMLLISVLDGAEYTKFPQWYYQIKDTTLQKELFFQILMPLVEKENQKILQERAFVKRFFTLYEQNPLSISDALLIKLAKLAYKYRIQGLYDKEEYLKKIDTIPISLVLAQAALESGWGKSRFSKIANNIFGEWTWGEKGIIPKDRDPDKNHKIKIFASLSDAIASYMLNLNRHPAYKEFRMARFLARKERRRFSGIEAAMTMRRYSQIGSLYTKLVSSIIKKNRLHFD